MNFFHRSPAALMQPSKPTVAFNFFNRTPVALTTQGPSDEGGSLCERPCSTTTALSVSLQASGSIRVFAFSPNSLSRSDDEDPDVSEASYASSYEDSEEHTSADENSDTFSQQEQEDDTREMVDDLALVPPEGKSFRGKPGRPRAAPGSKADTPANAQRRKRAAERRKEAALEKDWRVAVAAGEDMRADTLQQELCETIRGRTLFPSQTKTLAELKAIQQLSQNVKELNQGLGQKSKHRKDIATRVTKGLPPQFCQDVLGFDKASLRQFKKRSKESTSEPALIQESRSEGSGRVAWSAEFQAQLATFFKSRTEILSGAKTHTRKLLMSKGRLEVEFHAEFPAILRRAVERDPGMRPDAQKREQVLTIMEKNVLAAESAAEREGFSEAEEYKCRLDAELQRSVELLSHYLHSVFLVFSRRTEEEVYKHLRKRGLVVEAERKEKIKSVTMDTFDRQEHIITSVASSTLWKVGALLFSLVPSDPGALMWCS
jgi:hypothetical protein